MGLKLRLGPRTLVCRTCYTRASSTERHDGICLHDNVRASKVECHTGGESSMSNAPEAEHSRKRTGVEAAIASLM